MTDSIPYELIVTSAARPHLLEPTLTSLLRHVNQLPVRIQIHDDAVFADKWDAIQNAVAYACRNVFGRLDQAPLIRMTYANPPRRLGMAINWLIANVETPYVLYSQDDFVTVRSVPIIQALEVMHEHDLHHIRFNKRATMAFKETWSGPWYKQERTFGDAILTVSDHWYFQLGLWRVSEMKKALAFWTENEDRTRRLAIEEPENMLNHFFDNIAYHTDPTDAAHRAVSQRTFIWGPIGEDRYVRHIGGERSDWAGDHHRSGAIDDAAKAWREIASYQKGHDGK